MQILLNNDKFKIIEADNKVGLQKNQITKRLKFLMIYFLINFYLFNF